MRRIRHIASLRPATIKAYASSCLKTVTGDAALGPWRRLSETTQADGTKRRVWERAPLSSGRGPALRLAIEHGPGCEENQNACGWELENWSELRSLVRSSRRQAGTPE